MPYALTLALDDASAAIVRAQWRALAEIGLPCMAEHGVAPHISLAIWEGIDRAAMEQAVTAFAATTPVIDIVFTEIRIFATSGTVYLAPETSKPLRAAQAHGHHALAGRGRGAWAHYAPEAWAPHCTLVMDAGDVLDRVVAVARRAPLPLRARLERVELVEFPPARRLMAAPLAPR